MSDLMYATLFDRGYLLRGTAMIQSLLNHSRDARVTVLALDWETREFLSKRFERTQVDVIQLDDLTSDTLWDARLSRIYRDFCWTLSSVLCDQLLERHEEVIYLDADILFFNDPYELVQLCRSGEVAAVPHGFPERLRSYEANGVFNVQWVYFGGRQGKEACQRWKEQCLECCDLNPEAGVVGDQLYLDEWPSRYSAFVSLDHLGAGVAPWNHEVRNPRDASGTWMVDGEAPLIFYHFHGMKIADSGAVTMSGPIYSEVDPLPQPLYTEYLQKLADQWDAAKFLVPEPNPSTWLIADDRRTMATLVRRGAQLAISTVKARRKS
jgi:hypothetical protein